MTAVKEKSIVGITALQSIIRTTLVAAKAATDGFQNDDLAVYLNTIMTTAQGAKLALAELADLDPVEVCLLIESTTAAVRETFLTPSN
jgi:hypothetical protein